MDDLCVREEIIPSFFLAPLKIIMKYYYEILYTTSIYEYCKIKAQLIESSTLCIS